MFAQPHTWASAVLVDEFDAGQLERPSPSAKLRGFAASKVNAPAAIRTCLSSSLIKVESAGRK
jgi:hypothetical protein